MSDMRESERLYNILGELVEATDGSDKASMEQVTTTYEIDTSGLLKTVTADGVATSFEYDAAGNRTSVTNPDMGTAAGGKSVKFEYTGLGQVREREDGRGTTTYAYDLLGRPTSRVDPAGTGTVTATWSYDPAERQGAAGEPRLRRDGVQGDSTSTTRVTRGWRRRRRPSAKGAPRRRSSRATPTTAWAGRRPRRIRPC